MEDRETHEIITPLKGHKVVLRSWITGRESQKIDNAMVQGIGVTQQGKKQQLTPQIKEAALSAQENAAIESIVVSVDGNSNDVLNRVLDMRKQDYQAVVDEVERVVDGDLDEKKEIGSETNTTESSTEEKAESQTADSK